LRDGGLPDDDRFSRDTLIATLGEEAGATAWGEIEAARAFGDQMAAIRWATPGEIAERMAGLETEAAQPRAAGPLALVVARRERQLHDQPADYALANPHIAGLHHAMIEATAQPGLPPALAAALQAGGNTAASSAADLSQDDRRAATAAYANATLAEQQRLGVPEDRRRILPDAMAKEIAGAIAASDPAKADQTLRDLAADWGEDWPRVLEDMKRASLPGEYRLLAGFDDPVARQSFAQALTAQTNEPGAARARAGADADAIDGLLPAVLAPTLARIAQIHGDGAAGQAMSDEITRAARLLAYGQAPFIEPREAVRRAVADIGENALSRERPATADDGANPGWIGSAGEDAQAAAAPPDPDSQELQNQNNDKSLLERMFPPVSPEDAAERAAAMEAAGRRLGRHVSRVPEKPKAVPVFLKNSQRLKVFDANNQEVDAVIPEGWDLGYFAFMGERMRARDKFGEPQSHMSFSAVAPLALFRHGLDWDMQRIGAPRGKINHDFRPISTVAIGVYANAAGIPFEVMMEIQNTYAWMFSDFDASEPKSKNYPSLPESNVANTKRGYDLYNNGDVTAKFTKQ
jgi:hypothetical protein